jgi:hypothetical protein
LRKKICDCALGFSVQLLGVERFDTGTVERRLQLAAGLRDGYREVGGRLNHYPR